MEKVDKLMDAALSDVAKTLKDAVSKYGPDAVDLALVAFRIEAIQTLVFGVAYLGVAIAAYKFGNAVMHWTRDGWAENDEGSAMGRVVGLFTASATGLLAIAAALDNLLDIPSWVAALGYPELMIATKALEAAGLL